MGLQVEATGRYGNMTESRKPGIVYTFYSYKGGVGRSMALASVATLLSQMGRKVLMVDFDLEAPGLERYFADLGAIVGRRDEIAARDVDLLDEHKCHRLAWASILAVAVGGDDAGNARPRAGGDHDDLGTAMNAARRGRAGDAAKVRAAAAHALDRKAQRP